jgi:hypothetical protein
MTAISLHTKLRKMHLVTHLILNLCPLDFHILFTHLIFNLSSIDFHVLLWDHLGSGIMDWFNLRSVMPNLHSVVDYTAYKMD